VNKQVFEAGKTAYRQGNIVQAANLLVQAKQPGEVSGQVDHLLGNCYMKLGRYDDAAAVYANALHDAGYGHLGALACNRGRALLAAGKPQDAIASLSMVAKDSSYATPYKAQLALGKAYMAVGDARNAGVAFRSAAIDEGNPNPTDALSRLGDCFMKLGRAADAVEAYRTALDFVTPSENQNAIYADMGLAYVAANRMSEAADSFARATADGSYRLAPEAQAAYNAARKALSAKTASNPSETDALLAAAGYGTAAEVDPLDPLGKSGEFIPSPEDTGFFSVTEDELVAEDKKQKKVHRKHKHTGLKVFLIILAIFLVIAGAAVALYYHGYGWPTAESVSEELFNDASSGEDISALFAGSLSSTAREQIEKTLPTGVASVDVAGVDRSTYDSTVLLSVTLAEGGTQSYEVNLSRDGISWKVADVTVSYASQGGSTATIDSGSSQSATSSTSADDADSSASTATTD
jgi:Flp pilus assembly protein TadD